MYLALVSENYENLLKKTYTKEKHKGGTFGKSQWVQPSGKAKQQQKKAAQ